MNSPSATLWNSGRGTALRSAGLVLAAGWVYLPAGHGAWIWDDQLEISGNPVLRDPAGLGKIWFAPGGLDYLPLKTTVQWIAWRLWGNDPAGYHALNVGLHLLGAFLFWRLLVRLRAAAPSPRPAAPGAPIGFEWLAALLFVVHPLAVESVAWISELKNTLSLAFLLGAMLAYLAFDERWSALPPTRLPSDGVEPARWGQRAPPYLLALLLFILAMLSKSSVVMFPFVLLLHAWWKRGRVDRRDVLASLPFFAVSLALGAVTIWFQHDRAIAGVAVGAGGLWPHLAVAGLAAAFYLGQSVWPHGRLPIYPRWDVDPPSLAQFLPWLALAVLVAWLWTRRAGWGRTAGFGLGFFLLNLVPVLGFVPMAYHRIAWVSDHLAYLPLLGVLGLAAAALGSWATRLPAAGAWLPLAVGLAVGAGWAVESHRYAAVFTSNETLWTYALRGNPRAAFAENNLGQAYFSQHRLAEAAEHFQRAVALDPTDAEAHFNLGLTRLDAGRTPEALAEFDAALRLKPAFPEAENWRGNALASAGRWDEAVEAYRTALRLEPGYAQARGNLGVALARLSRTAEATAELQRALALQPDYGKAHANLGDLLVQANRPAEAIREYEAALRGGVETADLRNNLGSLLAQAGRLAEAEAQFRAALRLAPDDVEARQNLQQLQALKNGGNAP